MSDSDMLKAAEAEVERLKAELQESTVFQKLQLAEKVVALYRRSPVENALRRLVRPRPLPGEHTKAGRIEAVAVEFLKAKAKRATSGELLEAVTKAGIEITGSEPAKSLSAYLSNSKALNNVRECGGYGLKEWGTWPGPASKMNPEPEGSGSVNLD